MEIYVELRIGSSFLNDFFIVFILKTASTVFHKKLCLQDFKNCKAVLSSFS